MSILPLASSQFNISYTILEYENKDIELIKMDRAYLDIIDLHMHSFVYID